MLESCLPAQQQYMQSWPKAFNKSPKAMILRTFAVQVTPIHSSVQEFANCSRGRKTKIRGLKSKDSHQQGPPTYRSRQIFVATLHKPSILKAYILTPFSLKSQLEASLYTGSTPDSNREPQSSYKDQPYTKPRPL